jgi:hypothetical protein
MAWPRYTSAWSREKTTWPGRSRGCYGVAGTKPWLLHRCDFSISLLTIILCFYRYDLIYVLRQGLCRSSSCCGGRVGVCWPRRCSLAASAWRWHCRRGGRVVVVLAGGGAAVVGRGGWWWHTGPQNWFFQITGKCHVGRTCRALFHSGAACDSGSNIRASNIIQQNGPQTCPFQQLLDKWSTKLVFSNHLVGHVGRTCRALFHSGAACDSGSNIRASNIIQHNGIQKCPFQQLLDKGLHNWFFQITW